MLLWLFLLFSTVSGQSCPPTSSAFCRGGTVTSHPFLKKGCIYVCSTTSSYSQSYICKGAQLTVTTIASQGENDLAKAVLDEANIPTAFIGYKEVGGIWTWDDGSTSTFNKLVSSSQLSPTVQSQTTPTTINPAQKRRSTSIAVLIDASLYTTTGNILKQFDFYQQLATYVADRGDSEFAVSYFGCNTVTFTDYAKPDKAANEILSIRDTVMNTCVRDSPFHFADAVNYANYKYYIGHIRSYEYQALIVLSSITNASQISAAKPFTAEPKSSVVTISIGKDAASVQSLAIPSSNYIHIDDFSQMNQLVQKVDQMIFSSVKGAMANVEEPAKLATATMNAYLNASDGMWYPTTSSAQLNMLCTGPADTDPAPPTIPSSQACFTGFTVYTKRFKCYKIGETPKTFAEAMSDCQMPPLEKLPILTSMQSTEEKTELDKLIESLPGQAMFWIGLWREKDDGPWKWFNEEKFDSTTAFRKPGYPRSADGANCVTYYYPDGWVNTDCNKKIPSICEYRYQ